MATATETRTTKLAIQIGDAIYRVARLRVDTCTFRRGYRLTKPDGTSHDIHETVEGHQDCTCGDHVFRRALVDPEGCKHIKSLRIWGMVS